MVRKKREKGSREGLLIRGHWMSPKESGLVWSTLGEKKETIGFSPTTSLVSLLPLKRSGTDPREGLQNGDGKQVGKGLGEKKKDALEIEASRWKRQEREGMVGGKW